MPTDRPRVSIFVQAYNVAAYVGECLDSVLRQQDAPTYEVIVIDDASSDGTAGVIAGRSTPSMRLVTHDVNRGAIATANEGYALCRGEYILRIDADDRIRPGFLAAAVEALDRWPQCGLAYADIATMDASGRMTGTGGLVRRDGRPPVGDEFLPLLLENFLPAPCTLVRRTALAPHMPVPAHFRFLDWYLTTGIAEAWPFVYLDQVFADYRVHTGNMHRTMILDRSGEATSLEILDRRFAAPARADEKRRWRRHVYAQHYATYGDKYFGCGMSADARRCYWRAIALEPRRFVRDGVGRRALGSLVGRRLYDATKAVARGRPS